MRRTFILLFLGAFVFCYSSIAKSTNSGTIISIEKYLKPHNYYPVYYRIGFNNKNVVDIAVRSNIFVFEDYIKCLRFWAQQIACYKNRIEFGASFFSVSISKNQFLLFDYNRNHHFEYISCSGEIIPIKPNKSLQIDYNPSFPRSFFVYYFDLREDQLKYTDDSYIMCYYFDHSSSNYYRRPIGLYSPISDFIQKNFAFLYSTQKRNLIKIAKCNTVL